MLRCTHCFELKLEEAFHKRKANSLRNGRDSWCKVCKSIYRKQYFIKNQNKETKRSRLKAWKYQGIVFNFEQFEFMKKQQNFKCAICKIATEKFHVDHNHTTGKLRQLLCVRCNMGLGLFADNIDLLKSATTYLENHV